MIFTPARVFDALGDGFHDDVKAAAFPAHILRYRNQRWAEQVGLDGLQDSDWLDHFGQFMPLPGSFEVPKALRYHGHQFRTYNPDIGDGRGFLFAQLRDGAGRLLDLGTKGSGQTPWSRFGDGRLTLKGGVREVLATAMLEALGVNTSKSFSLIETGEALTRNDEPSPTRSAVLVRLSHSHIRYGTFQRLAYQQDAPRMERLVRYCLDHLLDCAKPVALADQVSLLMHEAVVRAATLAASYMAAGFVHGVLNTDNINITGESFDYGPYRFAPRHDPAFVAAYFDNFGLYAFGRQAEALHWNVYQLARSLLTLADQALLIPALETFPGVFEQAYAAAVLKRLGLMSETAAADVALAQNVAEVLEQSDISIDQFYFDCFGGPLSRARRAGSLSALSYAHGPMPGLCAALDQRRPLPGAASALAKPYFSQRSPCSLFINEIEAIWSRIDKEDDWCAFDDKLMTIHDMRETYALCARVK
jgi:serine/tyrosine/threonine adenylyltransferase